MFWKVLYDFRRPNWKAYGHVLFVIADTLQDASVAALEAIQHAEALDACVERVDVTEANEGAYTRWLLYRARHAQWAANVKVGIANAKDAV